jgi:hypothetical protein
VGAWTGSEAELTDSIEAFAELRAELDDPFGDPPATLARRNLDRAACERIEHTWKIRLGETGAESLAARFAEVYRKRVQELRTERHARAALQRPAEGAHRQPGSATRGGTHERRGAAPWPHADLARQLAAASVDETAAAVPVLLPALPFGPVADAAAQRETEPVASAPPRPKERPAASTDAVAFPGGSVAQAVADDAEDVDQTAELDLSKLRLARLQGVLPFGVGVDEGAGASPPARSQPNGSLPARREDSGERKSRDGDD